jgi:putative transposase
MDSFSPTLEVELVHQGRSASRDEAKREPLAYLEGYDNRQRLHSALGHRMPGQAGQLAT